ncbi:MAG: AI-2E family transporter [Solirubrobacterales bacterium]|nr:AI-2E family transporter [Solirubrobacterales bacterium]
MEPQPALSGARVVLRTVLVIVAVVLSLYVIYLLRQPITWVLLATFLAVALSGPVRWLSRWMGRGAAIALVFLGLLALPLLLAAAVLPPVVSEADDLVRDLPRYANDAQDFIQRNERLRELESDYNVVARLEDEAQKLPNRIGDAAGILRDVGFGLVNSVFALFTILVLSAFILGSGPRWREAALSLTHGDRAERLRRVSDRMAQAVGGYVAGALCIAGIAGASTFIVLSILGVPFAPPLAVLAGLFSLIPLIGATIAAILIAVVTLFTNFPTATIVWVIWAVLYQQLENYVIQPQVQKRTVNVQPFVVLVAVLFGSTLLGVLGALVAIPVAASIQVAVREWWDWRNDSRPSPAADDGDADPPEGDGAGGEAEPPDGDGPEPAAGGPMPKPAPA